jgi:hypothetical protein
MVAAVEAQAVILWQASLSRHLDMPSPLALVVLLWPTKRRQRAQTENHRCLEGTLHLAAVAAVRRLLLVRVNQVALERPVVAAARGLVLAVQRQIYKAIPARLERQTHKPIIGQAAVVVLDRLEVPAMRLEQAALVLQTRFLV